MGAIQYIAIALMLVPIAMMLVGLKRFRTRPADTLGLALAAAGDFLLFILGWIASGQFLYALMVSLVLVVVYCRKLTRSGVVRATAIGSVAAAVAFGVAIISISTRSAGCAEKKTRQSTQDRVNTYNEARIELTGEVLGDNLAGRRALVITRGMGESAIKRFKKGVDDRFEIVAMTPLPDPPADPETGQRKTKAQLLDLLLVDSDDYDLVICFERLPEQPKDMKFWKRPAETRPDFVLVQRSLAGKTSLLEKGWLSGIVTDLPITYDETNRWLDDPNSRYTIKKLVAALAGTVAYVDRDNLAEITKKYPGLLH